MADSFTSSNAIDLITTGTDNNTWGNVTNSNWTLVDQSLDGNAPLSVGGGSVTVAVTPSVLSSGRCRVLNFTGSYSGGLVTVPVTINPSNIQKSYWIYNNSANSLILSNGSGSALTIPSEFTSPAFCDGNGNVVGNLSGNNFGVSGITVASVTGGSWTVFQFGNGSGTVTQVAWGSGTGGNGFTIPFPAAFTFSLPNANFSAALSTFNASSGHYMESMTCGVNVSGGSAIINISGTDSAGSSLGSLIATWNGFAWVTGV